MPLHCGGLGCRECTRAVLSDHHGLSITDRDTNKAGSGPGTGPVTPAAAAAATTSAATAASASAADATAAAAAVAAAGTAAAAALVATFPVVADVASIGIGPKPVAQAIDPAEAAAAAAAAAAAVWSSHLSQHHLCGQIDQSRRIMYVSMVISPSQKQ